MHCDCLPFSELPHTTRLFATFLGDFDRVASFYGPPPSEEGLESAAREVNLDASVRRAVVEVLREQNRRLGTDESTERSLDRLAAGAVAVVTGQQVGLFSGPSFSFYKALTASAMARRLTERGTDAVPVFWLAAEDHDLAEVNHCFFIRSGNLERLELLPREDAVGRRVGEVALGPPVTATVDSAAEALEGPVAAEIRAALADSYRPEETFGSAFGKLMARLFAGRGVILLDPLDARLHRLALPLYRRALEENSVLTEELLARNKALEHAGYHAQAKVSEHGTLLFVNRDGRRQPLRQRNHAFVAGRAKFSAAELVEAIEATPEDFTANVLLRPVVQDTLLPTAVYIGGPAEVAYFAQAEVVYRRLLGRIPVVFPRASFTLVELHIARLLKRYGLDVRDVFGGRQHLRAKMEQAFLPRGLARQFTGGEKTIRRLLARLRLPINQLDKTLAGALDTAERKMLYQFLKLRAKAGRAENRRTGVLDDHERILLSSLYPQRALQERTVCFVGFLARHGLSLLDELERRALDSAANHQVLYL